MRRREFFLRGRAYINCNLGVWNHFDVFYKHSGVCIVSPGTNCHYLEGKHVPRNLANVECFECFLS